MPADIFEETERRSDFINDASNMRPEMARIFVAELSSCDAEGLAGIASMDDIHRFAPRFAVEGLNIVPDRSLTQSLICHPRHERGRSIGVPLDVTNSSISGDGDVESEVKTAGTSAERKSAQASPTIGCVSASGGR